MKSRTKTNSQLPAYGRTSISLSLKSGLLAMGLICAISASAQTTTTITNFTVSAMVPDGDPSGLASAKTVSTPISYITKVKASLKLTGTWNGDLYCYLVHSSGRTVLLNRVGRRAASGLGYDDEGFDVTFDDAGNDIHTYRLSLSGNQSTSITGALTGVWAPDARTNSPYNVLESDNRDAFLSSFNGLNPNGEWVLFVADAESGDIFTLDNWGLEITGYTPPSIASQPVNTSAECSTGSATFTVDANGTAPLAFQWRFNNIPISGATSSTLMIGNPTFASAGVYDVVITNSYGTLASSAATLTVADTTAPAITLLGANPLYVECHGSLVDPGATATDLCAGDLSGSISVGGSVNPNVPGTYTLTYDVQDPAGNSAAQMTRTVVVRDSLPPVPDLASLPDVNGQCSVNLTAPTATDACDGAITGTTTDPLTYTAQGDYTVHWTYADSHGNHVGQSQQVHVHDTIKPVITLVGNSSVTVECHSGYADAGATASDNCDGDVTSKIVTVNPVDANTPGTYTVTYNVSDLAGNAAVQISRTVTVQDTLAPVPNVASLADVNGQCSATVTTPTATDACEGAITGTTTDPLTYTAQGDYTVHWTYADSHGNHVGQTQQVHVHDTIKPIITLVGNSSVTVECHSGYTDAGATASDNCDGDITSKIVTVNPVDANTPGTYNVTYNVSDMVGNAAVQVTRTVIVSDTIAPTVALVGAASMTNECHTSFNDPGATASDNCAPTVSVITSGSVNPNAVGIYTLTYTATDPSGNTGTATRTVYVVDTIAPSIVVPANISVFTTNTSGTAVTFAVSADDACSGPITPTANPVSGSVFAIGTTTVNVTASDASGNTSNRTFTVTVVLNQAPVGNTTTLGAISGKPRSVLIEKLLAKANDSDGDILSITAVSANSTNGGTVTLSGTAITYTSASSYSGPDMFSYTISDNRGGIATGYVIVQVYPADALTPNITSISMGGGVCHIRFAGIPGFTYYIERTPTLSPANWGQIGSIVVPENGLADYTDGAPLTGSAYYRTATPLP